MRVDQRFEAALMKAEEAGLTIRQITLEAEAHAAEGEVSPGNLGWRQQCDFETFLAGSEVWAAETSAVEKMDLMDVCNADHRERRVNRHPRPSFLVSLAYGRIRGSLAVFHEPCREGPVAVAWLDGTAAH